MRLNISKKLRNGYYDNVMFFKVYKIDFYEHIVLHFNKYFYILELCDSIKTKLVVKITHRNKSRLYNLI